MNSNSDTANVSQDEMNAVANINVNVHLVERKVGNTSDYAVVVKTGKCLLVSLAADNTILYLERSIAASMQLSLGRAMYMMTVRKDIRPAIVFADGPQIHIPSMVNMVLANTYKLAPITLNAGNMSIMQFMNQVHASAYAGEFIDDLLTDSVDWKKLKITNSAMTL